MGYCAVKGEGMTRQIICKECAKTPLGQYPGGWAKRVNGVARIDFLCALCNADIPEGTSCVAQSFGLDRQPYYPWENDFITRKP